MPSLREELESALSEQTGEEPAELEAAQSEEQPADQAPEAEQPEEPARGEEPAEGERDTKGRFAGKKPGTPPVEKKPAESKPTPKPGKPAQMAGKEGAPATAEEPKAPQSWKPAVREHWAKLPPEVRAEVARREVEVTRALNEGQSHRKFAESFERVLTPYKALIHGEPLKVVEGLLQTAASLQTAPPAHKAQILASLIHTYGVDVEHINAALEGKPAPQAAQPSQPQQFRDERLDQLIGQVQQAHQQRAVGELQQFAVKAEFLDDVREDMADLLETAKLRGKPLTLEQAYEKACLLNEEVRSIVEQRKAAQATANATASTRRAKAASSSIRHEPTAPSKGAQSSSLRAMMEQAVEESSQ